MPEKELETTEQTVKTLDTDALCREAHPIIRYCLKQLPSFYTRGHEEEMYNAAIVAILENCGKYDPDKGSVAFFYKHIRGAFDKFIAKEIYDFSSYEKYRDYRKIRKVIPDIDSCDLTEDVYNEIFSVTGLGKTAVTAALNDSVIGKSSSIESMVDIQLRAQDTELSDHICQSELESVISTAMNCLTEEDRDFVYDMCGFGEKDVLPTPKLLQKYNLTPTMYDSYLQELQRKLLGSRKLRRYMGRTMLHEKYMVS